MTPSTSGYPRLQRGPARPVAIIGTLIFALVIVLLGYYFGREVLMKGHALFEGGR